MSIRIIKLAIRHLGAVVTYYSGLLQIYLYIKRRISGNRPLILTYHCFLPISDPARELLQQGMIISPEIFEKQLRVLKRHFRIKRLGDFISELRSGVKPDGNELAITIDDGWEDNYTYAFPVLKKADVPATIFLVAEHIGKVKAMWFLKAKAVLREGKFSKAQLERYLSRSARQETTKELTPTSANLENWFMGQLKRHHPNTIEEIIDEMAKECGIDLHKLDAYGQMLDWSKVKEMKQAGIEFGSHGCSHRILTRLSRAEIEAELLESRRIIKENLGDEPIGFSYPNGDYTYETASLVKQVGYLYAVSTAYKAKKENIAEFGDSLKYYTLRRINISDSVSLSLFGNFSKCLLYWHLAINY